MYNYKTKGTCSREINFDVLDNKIRNVHFIGGCDGNLKGLSNLLEGMPVEEAILKLKGIKCGHKNTSCPDQFSKALEQLVLKKQP